MTFTALDIAHAAALPAGGTSLLPSGGFPAFTQQGEQASLAKVQTVAVANQPFSQALQITTEKGASSIWNVQLVAPVNQGIRAGDVLMGHFWLRCVKSMTDEGYVGFVVEKSTPEFDKAVEFEISAAQDWREIFVPFKAMRDFPAGSAHLCFRLGYDSQTIELGGVELIDYGSSVDVATLPHTKISYEGRDENAAWRKAALARIEQIRKGDWIISVRDKSGEAASGVEVHVVLKRHAFGFGSCVDVGNLLDPGPNGEKYRQVIADNFNQAVFENDMKWQALWNGISPDLDKAVQWLLDHHIRIRGHNLLWPSWRWAPTPLLAYRNDPVKLQQIIAEHITQTVTHFKGKCFEWDVVNEPYSNHDITDILGRKAINDWYSLARQADPNCKLYINDFGMFTDSTHADAFYDIVKAMHTLGGPVDGIGIQSHFGEVLPGPEKILATFDRFAALGLPIESTEVSFSLDDQQLQADYMRDYLIACFSHPDVQGVMLWGFWETAARYWRPKAAMYTADWTLKPEGVVFQDLVHKQWNTDVTAKTDANGQVKIRGFYGEYEVTAGKKIVRATLSRNGQVDHLIAE
ncbi:MAG TPA: endo-1,4-beta-xylanase [Tepidisphaeraceae bacterium]|jgi:GH35 family endo-1,4-beta-xylanase